MQWHLRLQHFAKSKTILLQYTQRYPGFCHSTKMSVRALHLAVNILYSPDSIRFAIHSPQF